MSRRLYTCNRKLLKRPGGRRLLLATQACKDACGGPAIGEFIRADWCPGRTSQPRVVTRQNYIDYCDAAGIPVGTEFVYQDRRVCPSDSTDTNDTGFAPLQLSTSPPEGDFFYVENTRPTCCGSLFPGGTEDLYLTYREYFDQFGPDAPYITVTYGDNFPCADIFNNNGLAAWQYTQTETFTDSAASSGTLVQKVSQASLVTPPGSNTARAEGTTTRTFADGSIETTPISFIVGANAGVFAFNDLNGAIRSYDSKVGFVSIGPTSVQATGSGSEQTSVSFVTIQHSTEINYTIAEPVPPPAAACDTIDEAAILSGLGINVEGV